MAISGKLYAPGGADSATAQNINVDAGRLESGGTVLAFLQQTGGDNISWDTTPTYDAVLKVLAPDNAVLQTISLVDLMANGRNVLNLSVEPLAHGGFVVAWTAIEPADDQFANIEVRYAIFDDQGALVGQDLLAATPGRYTGVQLTALADGGFASVYHTASGPHPQSGVVSTFAYDAQSDGYLRLPDARVGDAQQPAPGTNADTGTLYPLSELAITALSDGGFVVGAQSYAYVSSTYTPLGDFVYRYGADGQPEAFESGTYWQRVNWNPGQHRNVVKVASFEGGFASLNRGQEGAWQITVFDNDGSLVTQTVRSASVTKDNGVVTREYHATDVTPFVGVTDEDIYNSDQAIDFQLLHGELVAVLPNPDGGLSMARISTVGVVLGIQDLGIAVPEGAKLTNARLLTEGAGYDLTYDVIYTDGSYLRQSTYEIGLAAPSNVAPVIADLDGDATDFVLGTPQYIDNGDFASVGDADSPSIDGGYLDVRQVTGAADGAFSFDLALENAKFLWGASGPDLSNDGVAFTPARVMAVGDRIWYTTVGGTDPGVWFAIGTVASDGQDGRPLRITLTYTEATIPAQANGSENFASDLIKFMTYTAPTLGARSFEARLADGDGAVSDPATFHMTGTSDQDASVGAGVLAEPARLSLGAQNAATAAPVFDFTLQDAGGADGLATRVKTLVLQTGGDGDFSKLTWLLSGPDIATAVTGSYQAGKLSFANLGISVADGASERYTVKAYFNDSTGVAAGTRYVLSLDGDSGVLLEDSLSSQMAPNQAAVGNGSGALVVSGPSVVSVLRAAPQTSLTNADSVSWTVRFSEAVQNVDQTDFDVAGLTGETIQVSHAGGNDYTVAVSGGGLAGLDGAITLGLASGHDIVNGDGAALASLAPSGADGREFVIDNTPPAAPIMALASDTGASASDGVSQAGTLNLALAPGASWEYRLDNGAWSAGSGATLALASGRHEAGTIQVRQSDAAGNLSQVGSNAAAIVIDAAAPTVAGIQRTSAGAPSGTERLTFEVRFADSSAGIDPLSVSTSGVSVSGPAALGAVSLESYNLATGVALYAVAAPAGGWSPAQAGSYTFSVGVGAAADLAGNPLAGAATTGQFTIGFNGAPLITSNGGGASATLELAEGLTAVTTVHAVDPDSDSVSYAITGGADAALFEIDAASGALRLRSAQRADQPHDSDANGSYLVEVGASDGHGGTALQALTVNVLADLDGDGTPDIHDSDRDGDGRPDSSEDPVPNANGAGIGDGNGDGIADSSQINVASLATLGSVAADKRFATIEVAAGLELTEVENSAAPSNLPRNVKMPLGQFGFEIHNVEVGGTVAINLYVDRTLGINGYYKLGAAGWSNLATASVVGNKTKLAFSLTDGGAFDADGVANGVIVDPGGPSIVAPRIVSSGGLVNGAATARENQVEVATVHADALGTVTYAISGGADAASFTIDPVSGVLRFATAPDYERPLDLGDGAANNTYVVDVTAVDEHGSDTQQLVVSVLDVNENPVQPPQPPQPVDDGDAIPAEVEQLVPALPGADGKPGVAGDGNGDGRPDNQQANVTSLPFLHSDHAQSNPGSAPPVYLTLVANSIDGKTPAGAGTAVLHEVMQLDAPTSAPAGLSMPLGQISFKASVAQAGAAEHFSIYIDGAIPINGYWKQDAAGDWINLAAAEHGGKVVVEGGRTRLDFTIVDGGQFDDDGKADGVITDPGAPGYLASGPDSDDDQFPDALESGHGLQVGIKDNDVFGSSKLFVMQLYRDLLLREAEAPEWGYWQGLLDRGVLDKPGLVSTFLDAVEFQGGAGAVTRLYFAAFDRAPDVAGLDYWTDQVFAGQKLSSVSGAMVDSAEFLASYGQLGNEAFVQQLYQNVLGRQGDAAGAAFWKTGLDAGLARGEVLLGFAQSAEFRVASDDAVTVALAYTGLLERAAEPAGAAYWLDTLEQGAPEVVVIGSFLDAPEYHDRFLP